MSKAEARDIYAVMVCLRVYLGALLRPRELIGAVSRRLAVT